MAAAVSVPRARSEALIELSRVSKDYDTGGGLVRAMRDVNMRIARGDFVAIVGTSGSGKSTMMNILGCLDRPTRGTYTLAGIDVGSRAGDSRAIVRNRVIGFIFQGFNLLARTTALENVELPLQYRGVAARERRHRARAALQAVGLADRLDHTPSQLSGGQQQRVAIARALVTDPPLLLADEPTGNLDTRTSLEVLALLQRLNRERGITIVLVTHERDIAACASRVVTMRDGRIVTDVVQEQPLDAATELAALAQSAEVDAAEARPWDGAEGSETARRDPPVPFSVYPVAWLANVGGYLAGSAYARFALHGSAPWLGALVGELALAYAGVAWLRRRLGRAPSAEQRLKVATVMTAAGLGLAGAVVFALARLEVPLPAGPVADRLFDPAAGSVPRVMAAICGLTLGVGLLRYLLLSLFSVSALAGRASALAGQAVSHARRRP
jgi:putative ABC transport system ATP-binding protein